MGGIDGVENAQGVFPTRIWDHTGIKELPEPQPCSGPSPTPTYHGPWVVCKGSVKGFDVFELKHVPLHKSFPDFLVSPGDEEFVIVIGLLCQARGKVNWSLQVHPFPGKEVTCDGQSISWLSMLGVHDWGVSQGFFGVSFPIFRSYKSIL